MFGSFSVINIIVLLNLLIAMMNHSYQLISVSSVRGNRTCFQKEYLFGFFPFFLLGGKEKNSDPEKEVLGHRRRQEIY